MSEMISVWHLKSSSFSKLMSNGDVIQRCPQSSFDTHTHTAKAIFWHLTQFSSYKSENGYVMKL